MSIFSKIKTGLKKTSNALSSGISGLFSSGQERADMLQELEELLIMADMGAPIASSLVQELNARLPKNTAEEAETRALLQSIITQKFEETQTPFHFEGAPCVVLAVGVNGNGKTTSLGKIAARLKAEGKQVMLVAADTFRAAAVAQLEQWATRAGVAFAKGESNSDPAAVVYQAIERAKQNAIDIVLVDTAGRLHTKHNLMQELQKITKVTGKLVEHAPHHVLQMIDATTGQNAMAQVKAFKEQAGVNGLVITKLDGTAKAGITLALSQAFNLPIRYIGVGEQTDDLLDFDAEAFAKGLF